MIADTDTLLKLTQLVGRSSPYCGDM